MLFTNLINYLWVHDTARRRIYCCFVKEPEQRRLDVCDLAGFGDFFWYTWSGQSGRYGRWTRVPEFLYGAGDGTYQLPIRKELRDVTQKIRRAGAYPFTGAFLIAPGRSLRSRV